MHLCDRSINLRNALFRNFVVVFRNINATGRSVVWIGKANEATILMHSSTRNIDELK